MTVDAYLTTRTLIRVEMTLEAAERTLENLGDDYADDQGKDPIKREAATAVLSLRTLRALLAKELEKADKPAEFDPDEGDDDMPVDPEDDEEYGHDVLAETDVDAAMEAKIKAALPKGQKLVVDYSAYQSRAEDDQPIDNLGEVAFRGRIKFKAGKSDYGGTRSQPWESPVLVDPTWLDLAVQANAMILKTKDRHHCFLEGFDVVGTEADCNLGEFCMGS